MSFNTIENWTPLHTRLLSHRLGDGTINVYRHAVWDNNRPKYFIDLLNHLGIKFWNPTKSGSTTKIVIPDLIFDEYAKIYNYNSLELRKNPNYLVKTFLSRNEDDIIQVLCACMFDDGSAKNWQPILFEDQKEELVENILQLWNLVIGFGAKINYATKTKKGTQMYHLVLSRDGFLSFYKKINDSIKKFGYLAGLWEKQNDLDIRYNVATNIRAQKLSETKNEINNWLEKLVLIAKSEKQLRFKDIKNYFNLSKDRTRNLINKAIYNGVLIKCGELQSAYYTLPEYKHIQHKVNLYKFDKTKKNKEILLIMAKNKEPRPAQGKHQLGRKLSHYTSKLSSCYDEEFNSKIRDIRPDWF